MIIRNIYRKININPFFYFLGLLSVFAGLFKSFLIMYLIVIIHELGHISMALLFNYEIVKINIYPFGGYTIFQNDINTSFTKEFMVFIGGILFQTISFIILFYFIPHTSYFYKVYSSYNLSILVFNLLPIVPLDGGKLLNMILNNLVSFKSAYKISIQISYIFVLISIIYFNNNINYILMCILLISLIIKENNNFKYIYNKFLLERYIKDLKFKKSNFINNKKIDNMKKYKYNVFIVNNRYIDETEMLKLHFK